MVAEAYPVESPCASHSEKAHDLPLGGTPSEANAYFNYVEFKCFIGKSASDSGAFQAPDGIPNVRNSHCPESTPPQ